MSEDRIPYVVNGHSIPPERAQREEKTMYRNPDEDDTATEGQAADAAATQPGGNDDDSGAAAGGDVTQADGE